MLIFTIIYVSLFLKHVVVITYVGLKISLVLTVANRSFFLRITEILFASWEISDGCQGKMVNYSVIIFLP